MTPDVNGLKVAFATNRSWSELATIVVFIGLLGDILVIFLFSKDKPKSETWLAFACTFLIAIGVFGEYRFGGKTSQAADQLQEISAGEVANSNQKAEEASKEARQLEKDAEGLKKAAQDEMLARVKIEASVAWRHLTDQQKADIGSALRRRFSNQGVSFWYNAGDTEGSWFAADIAEAVRAAHTLRVYSPGSIMTMRENGRVGDPIGRDHTGVTVQSTRDQRSSQLADAIVQELTLRGFNAARQTDPPYDPNPVPQVWVNVDPRPIGPQGEFKLAAQRLKNK